MRDLNEQPKHNESVAEKKERLNFLTHTYFRLALHALWARNFHEAEGYFRRAVEMDKTNLFFRGNLQNVLRVRGKYDEAREIIVGDRELLQKQIAANPDDISLHSGLAMSYHALGQIERAVGRLPEAEQLSKTGWRHWQQLSEREALSIQSCWWAHWAAEELVELAEHKLGNDKIARQECRRLIDGYSPDSYHHKSAELILEEIRRELGLSVGDELITPSWRKAGQKAEAAPVISDAPARRSPALPK